VSYLNIIKAMHDTHIVNIILSWEKTESISSNIRNKTRVSAPFLYSIVLEFLIGAIRREQEILGIQIGTEPCLQSLIFFLLSCFKYW
jgi:hypothetical protein